MKKIITLLLAIGLIISLSGCSKKKYEDGLALMESGDLLGAMELFDKIKKYEDAADLAKKCRFELIEGYLKENDYPSIGNISKGQSEEIIVEITELVTKNLANYFYYGDFKFNSSSSSILNEAIALYTQFKKAETVQVESLNLVLDKMEILDEYYGLFYSISNYNGEITDNIKALNGWIKAGDHNSISLMIERFNEIVDTIENKFPEDQKALAYCQGLKKIADGLAVEIDFSNSAATRKEGYNLRKEGIKNISDCQKDYNDNYVGVRKEIADKMLVAFPYN